MTPQVLTSDYTYQIYKLAMLFCITVKIDPSISLLLVKLQFKSTFSEKIHT